MKVSELITSKDIKFWNNGDVITVKAGTGKGKSYFIKNGLYEIAKEEGKKILMLIHRKNCVSQFNMEIEGDEKTDVIEIKTYQYIGTQNKDKNKVDFDFSEYSYIVCDEFHHFFDDSWTKFTDISLNAILEQKDKVRIFMSATGDNMKKYLNKHKHIQTIDYELPLEFDFIKHMEFYRYEETLEHYMNMAITRNKKAIFFINDTALAFKLHNRYKDRTLFNCSKSNKYYSFVDEEKINTMLKNERFEETVLITTTVFEAGVNIHDDELGIILCDNIRDTGTLLQCIGRKRLKENEKITLVLKLFSNQSLGGEETKISKKIEEANLFRELGATVYTDKYYRMDNKNASGIIYNESIGSESEVELKLNEVMFFKMVTQLQELIKMKDYNNKDNYRTYMEDVLNVKASIVYEDLVSKETLESYLASLVGKRLYKAEQNELIGKIDLRVDGKQQRGYKKLNGGLEMIGLQYIILPKRSNSERYWEIHQIDK
ncbi:DEAD/DEAH box helicase family protein [Bacillus sp. FJAT-22090]|uniref:DEAD/DEAH box helicase family protein n=1 Tax=Bacillus sp. FJAT-22090 TaxID=1581038 RepID=UPI0011A2DA90|nr:DEAD/DEAH box helicase family protein [Bacillus sp. FJAT-22090]